MSSEVYNHNLLLFKKFDQFEDRQAAPGERARGERAVHEAVRVQRGERVRAGPQHRERDGLAHRLLAHVQPAATASWRPRKIDIECVAVANSKFCSLTCFESAVLRSTFGRKVETN